MQQVFLVDCEKGAANSCGNLCRLMKACGEKGGLVCGPSWGLTGIGPRVSPLAFAFTLWVMAFLPVMGASIPLFAFGVWENTTLGLCCVPGLLPRVSWTLGKLGNLFAWRCSEAPACRPAIVLQAVWGKEGTLATPCLFHRGGSTSPR